MSALEQLHSLICCPCIFSVTSGSLSSRVQLTPPTTVTNSKVYDFSGLLKFRTIKPLPNITQYIFAQRHELVCLAIPSFHRHYGVFGVSLQPYGTTSAAA
jgi:hypothetical protein